MDSKPSHKVMSQIIEYDIEAKAWRQNGKLPVAVEWAPAVILADKVGTDQILFALYNVIARLSRWVCRCCCFFGPNPVSLPA